VNSISLIYKKNTSGVEQPNDDAYVVTYLSPDGMPATDAERGEVFFQFGKDVVDYRQRLKADPNAIIGEEGPENYRIKVERADGLGMTFDQFYICVLANQFIWIQGGEPTVVTITPTAIHRVVANLPEAGAHAWADAIEQLEPDSDEQVVELADVVGTQLLLDAGLVTRHVDGAQNQYLVPRTVAYSKLERS